MKLGNITRAANYILNPLQANPESSSKKAGAMALSIILGVASGGLVHLCSWSWTQWDSARLSRNESTAKLVDDVWAEYRALNNTPTPIKRNDSMVQSEMAEPVAEKNDPIPTPSENTPVMQAPKATPQAASEDRYSLEVRAENLASRHHDEKKGDLFKRLELDPATYLTLGKHTEIKPDMKVRLLSRLASQENNPDADALAFLVKNNLIGTYFDRLRIEKNFKMNEAQNLWSAAQM